ncbi:hypothetical protein BCR37DRAFT_395929 [Protomyces lactucae-debilis]|uniref:Uncharacterized protein n=1 Tax=Protomyces lactucae-debilis TaxID=2754530 RepID=A0A1Y2EQ49_PROLT|nr:uncharacterized protein BCR37DRAFT_395929 [Protomyces lactucae-debilis]ORY73668.1 hypothetical protein BCR37DRAFT_395929 [Protomyces lactucae-debilis]
MSVLQVFGSMAIISITLPSWTLLLLLNYDLFAKVSVATGLPTAGACQAWWLESEEPSTDPSTASDECPFVLKSRVKNEYLPRSVVGETVVKHTDYADCYFVNINEKCPHGPKSDHDGNYFSIKIKEQLASFGYFCPRAIKTN